MTECRKSECAFDDRILVIYRSMWNKKLSWLLRYRVNDIISYIEKKTNKNISLYVKKKIKKLYIFIANFQMGLGLESDKN